jgi:hypothetical protein
MFNFIDLRHEGEIAGPGPAKAARRPGLSFGFKGASL